MRRPGEGSGDGSVAQSRHEGGAKVESFCQSGHKQAQSQQQGGRGKWANQSKRHPEFRQNTLSHPPAAPSATSATPAVFAHLHPGPKPSNLHTPQHPSPTPLPRLTLTLGLTHSSYTKVASTPSPALARALRTRTLARCQVSSPLVSSPSTCSKGHEEAQAHISQL